MAAIDKERADLDTAIAAVERLASPTSNSTAERSIQDIRSISSRAFVGLTMPKAIEKYFALVDQPQKTRQIMEALKAGGVKAKGSFRGHVYNTLFRLSRNDGLFRHEPDSRWSLRKWKGVE